jgi:hypothetical protein
MAYPLPEPGDTVWAFSTPTLYDVPNGIREHIGTVVSVGNVQIRVRPTYTLRGYFVLDRQEWESQGHAGGYHASREAAINYALRKTQGAIQSTQRRVDDLLGLLDKLEQERDEMAADAEIGRV